MYEKTTKPAKNEVTQLLNETNIASLSIFVLKVL